MTVINTNLNSLVAQTALSRNNRSLSSAMEQLSTGKRINNAADDAAGLAISNKLTAQVRGLNQAVRNANDAISLIQTAEGATQEITRMLQRMRELSVQAANDTYTLEDRDAMQLEVNELLEEVTRIAENTQWNGQQIFNNSAASPSGIGDTAGTASFQVGANSTDEAIVVTFGAMDAEGLEIDGVDVTSQVAANGSIKVLDDAIELVNTERATYGAKINRLNHAADNLTNVSTNTAASRSRILDADYAMASSEMARTQIIQQAATAILAQANTSQQSVMKLLQ